MIMPIDMLYLLYTFNGVTQKNIYKEGTNNNCNTITNLHNINSIQLILLLLLLMAHIWLALTAD
jgi:hypothetical protein